MDILGTFSNVNPLLIEGIKMTLVISVVSILIGIVIGFLACIMGMSKNVILKGISATYVWIIRGTPMIVQAFIIYFAVPQVVQELVDPTFRIYQKFSAAV